jgi:hypothetical protein
MAFPPTPFPSASVRQAHQQHSKQSDDQKEDTKLASHGFSIEFRSAMFVGGPHACKAPSISMTGYS